MSTSPSSNVITFPKNRGVPSTLYEDLKKILAELLTFYGDDLPSFIEDCAQARGFKKGEQADRTLRSWARRQLEHFRAMSQIAG